MPGVSSARSGRCGPRAATRRGRPCSTGVSRPDSTAQLHAPPASRWRSQVSCRLGVAPAVAHELLAAEWRGALPPAGAAGTPGSRRCGGPGAHPAARPDPGGRAAPPPDPRPASARSAPRCGGRDRRGRAGGRRPGRRAVPLLGRGSPKDPAERAPRELDHLEGPAHPLAVAGRAAGPPSRDRPAAAGGTAPLGPLALRASRSWRARTRGEAGGSA